MTDIVLIGMNHKTAPVALRECIAISPEDTNVALGQLIRHPELQEVVLYSTCNRIEVLFVTKDRTAAIQSVRRFLSEYNRIPLEEFDRALYTYIGDDAIRHLFRVAASLDSMIVGEPQILGQIKDAYRMATVQKSSGVILNRLLHKSFFVAKRVRSETGIGDNAVSVSYAAIELGRKIFGNLEAKKVLLIGAGEMAELAVEHLIRNRVAGIWVANRTFAKGLELAQRFKGQAINMEELPDCLQFVDIIISSTGATSHVIQRQQVKKCLRARRNRPLFFIDIAVPRDIDPAINRITNCYVYNIDDLKEIVDDNVEDRKREAIKGERMVEESTIRFREWLDSLEVTPTLKALRRKMEEIADQEMQRTLQAMSHLTPGDRQAVAKMTQVIINKIMHDPVLFLKRNGSHDNPKNIIAVTRKLFKLDSLTMPSVRDKELE
jgi:glutamyl-tRNA reductase